MKIDITQLNGATVRKLANELRKQNNCSGCGIKTRELQRISLESGKIAILPMCLDCQFKITGPALACLLQAIAAELPDARFKKVTLR